MEERELIELAGVYCVDEVFTLEGVEKLGAARNVFVVGGERCWEPEEEGCDAGGEEWGVPRVPTGISVSK
jgi:hypothetical protein